MTIAKDFAQKASIAFVALAMIFSLVAPGAFAQAQTAEELQQMINQLMQQIAALQAGGTTTSGSATSTGFVWTRDLKTGATGADVKELQKFLNSDLDTRVAATGAGSVGMETDYFGPATAAAVSKFQVKYRSEILSPSGLVNPTGFFGPSTRAKANALNTVAVVPPVDTGTSTGTSTDEDKNDDDKKGDTALKGGEADVKSIDIYSEDDASADAKSQEVASFELDLGRNSGDVRVTRVDVHAKATAKTPGVTEDRLYRIIDAISIVQDGKVLGTARTSARNDWSNSSAVITTGGQYVRISGLNGVARGDGRTSFGVVIDTARLAASDLDIDIQLGVDVRYEDSTGAFETEDTSTINFLVEDEGAADLKVRANRNNPEAYIIKGYDNKTVTSDDILVFDVESKDADSTLDTIDAEIVVSTGSASDVVRKAVLYSGSTRVDSQNLTAATSSTSTVTFDLRDYDLRADRPEAFSVRLELNKIDNVKVTDNTKITTKVTGVDGYDESDNAIVSSSIVTSKEHTYSTVSAQISNYKWEVPAAGNFVDFYFTVKADDEDFDVKIADVVSAVTGTATTTSPAVLTGSTGTYVTNGVSNFTVEEGNTATFRVRFDVNGSNGAYLDVKVESVAGQSVPTDKQISPTATRNVNS